MRCILAQTMLCSPGVKHFYGLLLSSVIGNLPTAEFVDVNAVSGQTNYYKVATYTSCGVSPFSSALAVFLPLPALGVNASSNALTLTWPDWADDWTVLSASNLVPPVTWAPVTNTPSSSNGLFHLNLPIGAGNEFFLLSSP